jgi:excisionase family DNA binding protein
MASARLAYSPAEVARGMRVSRETVMTWIHTGRLRAADVGSARPSYRISAADLAEFMESRAVKPRAKRPPTRLVTERTKEEWF